MFGIGMPELIVILVVALVVLGPQRLPELARTLGKAMAEFRRQTSDIVEDLQATLEEDKRPRPPAAKPVVPQVEPTPPESAATRPDKPEPGAA